MKWYYVPYKERVEMGKIEVKEVVKPQITFRNIGNSIGFIVGMILTAISIVFIVSIILIIPGLFGLLIGLVVMVATVPKSEVKCRACETVNRAAPPNKRIECEACGTITPIKWISRRKYNQRKKA